MGRIKGIEVLKAELRAFLDEVIYSISEEMVRIDRTVNISELRYNSFGSEVSIYVEAIRLPENKTITIETSFSDLDEKTLNDFVSDSEIGYDHLIDLLELLKELEGGYGEQASILKKVDNQSISFDMGDDDWICICSGWDNLYRCHRCGHVIDQRNHKVIGINLNPTAENDIESDFEGDLYSVWIK